MFFFIVRAEGGRARTSSRGSRADRDDDVTFAAAVGAALGGIELAVEDGINLGLERRGMMVSLAACGGEARPGDGWW